MNVWDVVPREDARRNGWEIIKSRWIDVNKGDDISAQYRSRLVGKEFADKRIDGLFAGTPPLEALRFLAHEAATVEGSGIVGDGSQEEKVIMINDVARAFFEAKAIRKICVELPDECAESRGGRNVGLLKQSLYGTRDAGGEGYGQVGIPKGTIQPMPVLARRVGNPGIPSRRRLRECWK